ncbi:ABC transporter ATP-binding protein [Alteromonas confluentis]|uniref:ABC transporter ATP-binding protein n=1 Tax=Alteromonas confluentis TaxID=1656094 RepID=A0A1E7ZFW7_9ALTE|nr:ABC transporter ATP-binding protein [Alteromonas confluentis]OFC72370.1 ABC transporter ATP-binding protein [Alteromonas confluentis]
MLEVNGLSVDYGSNRVVRNLDLKLNESEILMLVGPTGCGKTTVLQALAGLIPVTEGKIAQGGWISTPEKSVPPEKRNVGMVFQDFALFPHLTVEQNVQFRLKDNTLADHWLELLGLSDFRQAKPSRLSGGQKQRVALARTLAHEPSYVLLDEPLSNLDAALKDTLRWDIRDALKKAGVPAIWVTHDQDEALSVGDRVGILNKGVLEQLDTPEQCFEKPASKFVARFLGEASFLQGRIAGSNVETAIGSAPVYTANNAQELVELLVRPDDVIVSHSPEHANATVLRSRFEGGSRLLFAALDSGETVSARVSHELKVMPDQRVHLTLQSSHPLSALSQ